MTKAELLKLLEEVPEDTAIFIRLNDYDTDPVTTCGMEKVWFPIDGGLRRNGKAFVLHSDNWWD